MANTKEVIRNTELVMSLLATAARLVGRDDAGVFLLHAMTAAAVEDKLSLGELEKHVRESYQMHVAARTAALQAHNDSKETRH